MLEESSELLPYLCPERKISFDGFINYEGRRFGVPYRYQVICVFDITYLILL